MVKVDLSGYKNLYLQTAKEYLNKLSVSLDELSRDVSNKEALNNLHIASHSLKSQSQVMGFIDITVLSGAIEKKSRDILVGVAQADDKFIIQNLELRIIKAPGHTPGGCCFYVEKENALFTGDTLFKEGVGRTNLSYSSKEDLKKSLRKIFELPAGTVIYPGHGEETIIEEELLSSP